MHSTNPSREAAKQAIAPPLLQTPPAAIAPEGDIPKNGTVSTGRTLIHLFRLIIWESNQVNRTSH
ncbi:hypothetical protein H6F96_21845 [Microcoleus sp. FACHB-53]|nr:hypothetical protein [Microcoleus sp. FACHB-53]